jgi:hypothetical protein
MPKSPALAFLMGMLPGALLATLIVLHVTANQIEAHSAATYASFSAAERTNQEQSDMAQKVIDAWRGRAETCEAKFAVGTIVYQQQPLASFALLHGVAAFDLNDPRSPKPSLYIPAQVDIYTNRPDVNYQWMDKRTGDAKGMQRAHLPSEVK